MSPFKITQRVVVTGQPAGTQPNPIRAELIGREGIVAGVSFSHTPPLYTVLLDGDDTEYAFYEDELKEA